MNNFHLKYILKLFVARPEVNLARSDSVLQATAALDFLDHLDSGSQVWNSSATATHNRGDDYDVNDTKQSSDDNSVTVTVSDKLEQQRRHREPPRFIAPPPPIEPPPPVSDDDANSVVSCRSQSPLAGNVTSTTDVVPSQSPSAVTADDTSVVADNTPANPTISERDTRSMFAFLDDDKTHDETDNNKQTTDSNGLDSPATSSSTATPNAVTSRPRSWLFRNQAKVVDPEGSMASRRSNRTPEVINAFFARHNSDDVELPAAATGERNSRMIYLDKTFRTLGSYISSHINTLLYYAVCYYVLAYITTELDGSYASTGSVLVGYGPT